MKTVLFLLLCAVVYVIAEPDGECPTEEGPLPTYLPDKEMCSIFYECSAGKAWLFKCGPGTYFNIDKNVCDTHVSCGDRSTTSTTHATTSA